MTLLALSLVAGVLVDDAIVEIENIVRHMRMGKSAYQASIDAADEIGLAVLATTMSIVAVFLPVGLMPGISGQFFKNFGLTVVVCGADEPRRRAPDHADDRGLFPASRTAPAAHGEGVADGRLYGHARLDAGHRQGARLRARTAASGARSRACFRDHRVWRWSALGVFAFLLTIVLFATLPMTFQPRRINGHVDVQVIDMVPGTTLAADRGGGRPRSRR